MNKFYMNGQYIGRKFRAPAEVDGADEGTPVGDVSDAPTEDDENLDWLFQDEGDEDEDPAPEAETVTEENPATVTEDEPAPEPEPTPEPEPEPEPEADKPDDEPEVTEPDVITDEQKAEQHSKYLAEVEKQFAFSEEDANLLLTAPETILPRVAANLHDFTMKQVSEMQQQLITALPQLVQQIATQSTQATKHEADFRSANPHLKDVSEADLNTMVTEYAPIIAKQMKGKSAEEKLKALGDVIATVKGIPARTLFKEDAPASPASPSAAPHRPAAPAQSRVTSAAPAAPTSGDSFIDELLQFANE